MTKECIVYDVDEDPVGIYFKNALGIASEAVFSCQMEWDLIRAMDYQNVNTSWSASVSQAFVLFRHYEFAACVAWEQLASFGTREVLYKMTAKFTMDETNSYKLEIIDINGGTKVDNITLTDDPHSKIVEALNVRYNDWLKTAGILI
jgi:hypothetical protein